MKVKYVSHASIYIESRAINLLTDPWMHSPIYGNMLWQFPPAAIDICDLQPIDVIYISHYHPDHFCLDTVDCLSSDSLFLLPSLSSAESMAKQLVDKGKKVYLISDGESYSIGDIVLTCYHHENGIDSSLVVYEPATDTSIYNMNDCFHSTEKNKLISDKHNSIDLGFLFYIGLGPYPGCFDNISTSDKYTIIQQKREASFHRFCNTAEELGIKLAIPYSSDMTWYRRPDLQSLNTCHKQLLVQYLNQFDSGSHIQIMESGDIADTVDLSIQCVSPYHQLSSQDLDALSNYIQQSPAITRQIQCIEQYEHQAPMVKTNELITHLFPAVCASSDVVNSGFKVSVSIDDNCSSEFVHLVYCESIGIQRVQSQSLISYFYGEDNVLHISFEKKTLNAVYFGILTIEDLLNSRFRARRSFPYSKVEESFWHKLSQLSCPVKTANNFIEQPQKISSRELFAIVLPWLEANK